MILPFVLAITVSTGPISTKEYQLSNSYNTSYTTRDINPDPYSYIRDKNSDIIYQDISKELISEDQLKFKEDR